jgi:hypothetical protein
MFLGFWSFPQIVFRPVSTVVALSSGSISIAQLESFFIMKYALGWGANAFFDVCKMCVFYDGKGIY